MLINGKQISLKRLTEEFATDTYACWMNDKAINQYLESRFCYQTIETLKEFIQSVSNDRNYAFAIIDNESGKHIGNIKIGSIDKRYSRADLGFLIGDKAFWGKGVASEAIGLCVTFAFEILKLHKIYGGVYSQNIGSIKAFLKNGFSQEGIFHDHCILNNGEYTDIIMFAKFNK